MDYRAYFQGEYLNAAELGKATPTVRIIGIKLVDVPVIGKDGDVDEAKTKAKGVLYFEGKKRGIVLNRTNAQAIAAMFGLDTDGWMGKRITIHAVPVKVGNKTEPGIRVMGSPDIKAPVTFELTLPRKRPVKTTLQVTVLGRNGAAAPPAPEPPPAEDPPPPDDSVPETDNADVPF